MNKKILSISEGKINVHARREAERLGLGLSKKLIGYNKPIDMVPLSGANPIGGVHPP